MLLPSQPTSNLQKPHCYSTISRTLEPQQLSHIYDDMQCTAVKPSPPLSTPPPSDRRYPPHMYDEYEVIPSLQYHHHTAIIPHPPQCRETDMVSIKLHCCTAITFIAGKCFSTEGMQQRMGISQSYLHATTSWSDRFMDR